MKYLAGILILPVFLSGPLMAAPSVKAGFQLDTFVSGVTTPISLMTDAAGNLYIGDDNTNQVLRVGPSGGTPTSFITGTPTPEGMIFGSGAFGDSIYLADGNGAISGTCRIIKAPLTGGAATTFWTSDGGGESWPFDLDIDTVGDFGGAIYQVDSGGPDTILKVTAQATRTVLATTVENFSSLEFSPSSGTSFTRGLYTFHEAESGGPGEIRRYKPDGTYVQLLQAGTDIADGRFASGNSCFGDLLYYSNSTENNIRTVNPSGQSADFASGFSFSNLHFVSGSMAFDPTGNILYVADTGAGKIYRIRPDDGPDLDGDGGADVCDPDDDNDTILDVADNCPTVANTNQANLDGDSNGDVCDDDIDGDGYTVAQGDCNDLASSVHPDAVEVCNQVDDDCDTIIDDNPIEGDSQGYPDVDGDGFGDESAQITSFCGSLPEGYVTDNTDCDDDDEDISPNGVEICNEVDDNCDGQIDEGVTTTYYPDEDGDGYGDEGGAVAACDPPGGYVPVGGDPDDSDPDTYPGAPEICDGADNDGDGQVDEGLLVVVWSDGDGDHYGVGDPMGSVCVVGPGQAAVDGDCDDSNDAVYPGATEVCNGQDDDCDGAVDEGTTLTIYDDTDGDGFGDPQTATQACTSGNGTTTVTGDCDDNTDAVNPQAEEIPYNNLDDNCDGIDLVDVDEDGFAGEQGGGADCEDDDDTIFPGAEEIPYDGTDNDCQGGDLVDVDGDGFDGVQVEGPDCDDDNPNTYPGAAEFADGEDNDCDGSIDEDLDTTDDDGDGYSEATGDCDDGDVNISPDADETCDSVDNNCNGEVDEGFDADGDGHNDVQLCADVGDDCDDDDGQVYPGAAEVANGIDDNCDGVVDEHTDAYDDDSDGYSEQGGDCNDNNDAVNPGEVELCDGNIDEDCDGIVDDGCGSPDQDEDGYTVANGDCDDNNPDVNPGEVEIPNGIDDNCDGAVDEDVDPTETPTEAPSETPTETPTAAPSETPTEAPSETPTEAPTEAPSESPTYVPSETPGQVPTAEPTPSPGAGDVDGDGYPALDAEGNSVDCNDQDPAIYPGAPEVDNGIDDNCDGEVDEGADSGLLAHGGGGCNSRGDTTPVALGWLLLLGLASHRRRS